jgi:nucleoside-diphosphate-sugar epimerase
MKKILITGALGQIGTELAVKMSEEYGEDNIIISDIIKKEDAEIINRFTFEILDVLDIKKLSEIVDKHKINYIIHLVSLLSATGEKFPQKLWEINMGGLYNVLEVAREKNLGVFVPSSIAAFGSSTPMNKTPQDTIQRPNTIYGISKVSGELLCDYYFNKFGVDTRGLRFPGLISHTALPGGGTTDYAVDIYYKAIQNQKFICPLKEDTYLDMMYMSDALDSIFKLIEADPFKLIHRNAFNVSSMSISPSDIANSIKKFIPEFEISYDVNPVLQAIANSWPNSMDVISAKIEWGFSPKVDLESMTKIMLDNLQFQQNIEE